MKKIILLLTLFVSLNLHAADTYLGGKIYDITSIPAGLLIRLEGNAVPTACADLNAWGWMLIPEENKTMISVALAMLAQGKKSATVYTSGSVGSYCKVIQYDPS